MVVITSHLNTDFDAFASMVAASRMYKDAVLYVPGSFSACMRRFHTFYKHFFPIEKHITGMKVTGIVIVDAGLDNVDPALKKLALSGVKTIIYDHHQPRNIPKRKNIRFVQVKYGACATLLAGKLLAKKTEISKEEAMLYMLGIAADTGSFTFLNTKPQDIKVSGQLMERGVDIKLYSDFLKERLDDAGLKLFNTLMASSAVTNIAGRRIMSVHADMEKHNQHLPEIVMNIHSVTTVDAVFCAAKAGNKIYLVARSSDAGIDTGRVLKRFGGGGHATASAAVVKAVPGMTAALLAQEMINTLASLSPKAKLVRDIMSTPVRAIDPGLKMEDAYKVCIRLGNNGLPVVKNAKLAGFITRADIEKGIHHKLGSIPVAGYMTTKVFTTTPETPVSEAQRLMEKENIGHLPVLHKGRLAGMVTRNDILNRVYGNASAKEPVVFSEKRANVASMMASRMDPGVLELVKKIGAMADKKGLHAYLVGGMVRDLLLRVKDLDIDITVEGDGMEFARHLADTLGAAYKGFERFRTGKVFMKDGTRIDVASARSEFYEFPAALPSIKFTPIRYDMYRRDFTINAMAIRINREHFGDLMDFFNGRQDLKKGLVRTLYNMSFIDDPTRILRAVRFETRHAFTIEPNTLRFIRETLRQNIFENLPGERLKDELFILFREPEPFRAVKRLDGLGILRRISPGLRVDASTSALFASIGRQAAMISGYGADREILYFIAMAGSLSAVQAASLSAKLKLSNGEKTAVAHAKELQAMAAKGLKRGMPSRSRTYFMLKKYGTEALLYLMLLLKDKKQAAAIKHFLTELRHVKILINGKDLKELGIAEGPEYSRILAAVMKARLDGHAVTRGQQLTLAAKLADRKK